jgi:anaerobic magnesium-protoporphyrin IX monomethyl ester cyclase
MYDHQRRTAIPPAKRIGSTAVKFAKAVIVNPPSPAGYMSNKDSMGGFGQLYPKGAPPFPPLDLAYLAGVLSAAGHHCDVVEAGALEFSVGQAVHAVGAVGDLEHALVLVRTSLPTVDFDLAFCRSLRTLGKLGAVALFGPPVPSLLRRIEQETSLDFAILTEADHPALELMEGRTPESILGLLYRSEGEWHRTLERPFERDLDSIAFPRWESLPIERYVIPKSSTSGKARFLPMLSSRGCPFGCSYCPYPVGQGLKWRFRSPANVVDEMEHLVKRFNVEHILFRDPMFSAQQKRVVAICEEIIRRGLKVHWKCETRIDCLDAHTIEMMARAGCVGVNFGVESTDPEVQKGVHRQPITVAEFVSVVALCRQHGIATFAFFVIGLPGDTLQTILDSVDFATRIRASWVQFTVATPFIGTPMFDWAVDGGFIRPDAYKIVNAHGASVGNENLSPSDIKRLHRFAQFLQDHVINRHGILKNGQRQGRVYRAAKRAADALSDASAQILATAAKRYFAMTIKTQPPRPKVKLGISRPVQFAARDGRVIVPPVS